MKAFVNNAGHGIPNFWNEEMHKFAPGFVVRLTDGDHLMLEIKGFDERKDAMVGAARPWCAAMKAQGGHGRWGCALADAPEKVPGTLQEAGLPMQGQKISMEKPGDPEVPPGR